MYIWRIGNPWTEISKRVRDNEEYMSSRTKEKVCGTLETSKEKGSNSQEYERVNVW